MLLLNLKRFFLKMKNNLVYSINKDPKALEKLENEKTPTIVIN